MIDIKDIKLGFWIGAGLALFTLVISLVSRLAGRAIDRGQS